MALTEEVLRRDLKDAMLAKRALRVRVLRGLLAAVKNRSIEVRGVELDEADMIAIVKREAKQCRETLEFARQAGRTETIAEQEEVLSIVEEYLPAQLDESDLRREIEAIVEAIDAPSLGPVMKELSARHGGRFDGRMASRIAGEILASRRG